MPPVMTAVLLHASTPAVLLVSRWLFPLVRAKIYIQIMNYIMNYIPSYLFSLFFVKILIAQILFPTNPGLVVDWLGRVYGSVGFTADFRFHPSA